MRFLIPYFVLNLTKSDKVERKIKVCRKETGAVLLLLSFSMLNLLFMHYYIYFHHYIEDVVLAYLKGFNFFSVIFDATVLLLLFLLITWKRLKLSLLLTFVITLLWSFVNVFYVRFFDQYLSLSAMSQTGNLTDQAVMNSMLAGFQWTDLFYPLMITTFVLTYRKVGKLELKKKMLRTLLITPLCSLFLIFLTYSLYHVVKSDTRGNSKLYIQRIRGIIKNEARNSFPNMERFGAGSLRIIMWEVYDMFHTIELTPEQREMIATEAADISQRVTTHEHNDSISNAVFIVLESFLSAPIGLTVDGKEITPFLNSLKEDSTVYYNAHVTPNITMGESGDGQFIFMTGLLPLRDKLTVGEAKSLTLPAFPKLLAKQYGTQYTEIVMPSPPQIWEQPHMNKVYGIDQMYCNRDVLGEVVDYLNDEQIFTLAMSTPAPQRQPFFSMVLSYSTHQPYRTPVDNSLTLSDPTLTNAYKNYLIACHYADVWIQKYLKYLKQKDAFDNSLIVITADHHAHMDALNMGDKVKKELPLFIINGNIDNATAWTGEMNQLDVFTTLLDILGIESDWHGLGHSVLSSDYQNSLTEKAWELSELIIKGRYFGSNE